MAYEDTMVEERGRERTKTVRCILMQASCIGPASGGSEGDQSTTPGHVSGWVKRRAGVSGLIVEKSFKINIQQTPLLLLHILQGAFPTPSYVGIFALANT